MANFKRLWLILLALPALALGQSANTYVPGPSPYAPALPVTNGQCLVWSSTAGPNLNGAWVNAACGSSGGYAPQTAQTVLSNNTGSTAAPIANTALPTGLTTSAGGVVVGTTDTESLSNKTGSCTPNSSGSAGTNTWTGLMSACKVFDVLAYGAKCDGSTNDTTAINAAFTAARTWVGTLFQTAKVLFPPSANCTITGTINVTGFEVFPGALIVEGQGSYIYLNGNATVPVIDALGSQGVTLQDLNVYASSGNQTYGLQFGKYADSGTGSSGGRDFRIYNVTVEGSFSKGACLNESSETTVFVNWSCANTNSGAGTFGLIMDGAFHWNPTSAFVTVTATPDTYMSFNGDTFIGGEFTASSSAGGPVWMENSIDHHYIGVFTYNSVANGSCWWLFNTSFSGSYGNNRGIDIDNECEGNSLKSDFMLTGPGSGTNFTATPTVRSLHYKVAHENAATSIFQIASGSNITGVTTQNLTLDIIGGPSSSPPTVFDTAANYTASGSGYFYLTGIWNGVGASQFVYNVAGAVNAEFTNLGATGPIIAGNGILSEGTSATVSGCSTTTTSGGPEAGYFSVGAGASPCTFVITVGGAGGPTAPNFWVCWAYDQTANVLLTQSTQSNRTCSMKGNVSTSDVVIWSVLRGN